MTARVVVRCDCGWSAEVDDSLEADLTHDCTLVLDGVDFTTTPVCGATECENEATSAGRSRCIGDGHAWQLVCEQHRTAADRKWSRTRIAWCVEHQQPIGSPAFDWRSL